MKDRGRSEARNLECGRLDQINSCEPHPNDICSQANGLGIYTTTIAILGDRYKGGELVSVYALLSIAWGIGALAGPLVGGMAMEITPHGLPIFATLTCGLFTGFAMFDKARNNNSGKGIETDPASETS